MNKTSLLPVKAVLFDLDDTLFDHLYSTRRGLEAVCQAYNCFEHCSVDELFATYTRLLDEVHLLVLNGTLSIDQARLQRFRRFFECYAPDISDLAGAVERAASLHRSAYMGARQVVAGALPLLEYLHGRVKIGIVTNNIVAEQVEKLRYLRLEHLVDELVTSEEAGFIKPDPGIFRVALQRLGCSAAETVMVGDSWNADILGAQQAGIRAIWLNRLAVLCPDPELAREIQALEPLEAVLEALLQDTLTQQKHSPDAGTAYS